MSPAPDGLLVVDKPAGLTSHDVVGRVRRLAGTRRVGHAGTLDPMATGVLVLGIERATRLLGHLALTEKAYTATVRLGVTTVTDDAEGEVVESSDAGAVTDAAIAREVAALTGEILQVPSRVSAVKVDGRRAYARVREGEAVELAARPVTVNRFDVVAHRREAGYLDLDVEVECSSGTYVRALARDLGTALGVGGHLTALRRTRVGPYDLSGAHALDELEGPAEAGGRVAADLPVLPLAEAAAVAFPRHDVDAETARRVRHGAAVARTGRGDGPVAVFGPDGEFLALVQDRGPRAKTLAVFAGA
ncbi:MAG TPA: tRNA pseudouridine(55) synthase TruB [Jiangellales bacterium]|nr:tRNA pseudouridine(55) synthase TruB [Jiangellales bacterium]